MKKTKAERRLAKRLRREHDQIFEEAKVATHPLNIFAEDEVRLILEFKGLMETFEFKLPRICRKLHDQFVAMEILQIQSARDGAPEEISKNFAEAGYICCLVFDEIVRTETVSQDDREMCAEIVKERTHMKTDDYMNGVIEASVRWNPFRDYAFWKRKWLLTLRTRKKLATKYGFPTAKGLPLLRYAYSVQDGDSEVTICMPR